MAIRHIEHILYNESFTNQGKVPSFHRDEFLNIFFSLCLRNKISNYLSEIKVNYIPSYQSY